MKVNRTESLKIRMTPDELTLYKATAEKMGMTLSGYIRWAMKMGVQANLTFVRPTDKDRKNARMSTYCPTKETQNERPSIAPEETREPIPEDILQALAKRF